VLSSTAGVPVLTPAVVQELRHIAAAAADEGNVIILRSQDRVFCAGIDMSEADRDTDDGLLSKFIQIELLLGEIRRAKVPTIAVVAGAAVGAGADLAAACSIRVGTENASFRFPGYGFGLLLGTGRLTRLVGSAHATRLVAEGVPVRAVEAVRIALLDEVVDGTEADALAAALARLHVSPTADRGLVQALRELEEEAAHGDLARLVRSASGPGLRDRFVSHRDRARAAATSSRR
jgi:enoyl-CoA hydratase/carnithine racemase